MVDELVVYLLLGLLLSGLGHPLFPFLPLEFNEVNVPFADSSHCLSLYGLVEAFDLSKGMRFLLVGLEGLVRQGVISLAVRAKNEFSRTDQTNEVGSVEIGTLAFLASLAKFNSLLSVPEYLVLLLQFLSDVSSSKKHDVSHCVRKIINGFIVLLGSH